MEYIHTQKNITTSPRKLRLVADMVRKMIPLEAVEALQFTNKTAAIPLMKAIKTAMANAASNAAGAQKDVVFKKIAINEGAKLKRYRVGTAGRGRGRPYKRRWSHIKIVLTDEIQVKSQNAKVKSTSKNKKFKEVKVANENTQKEKEVGKQK